MANFGDYITNEYAILRLILNNLTLTDLLTARKVCRSWHRCVISILQNVDSAKSPHILYTDQLFYDNEVDHWDKLRIIPEVLIRFSTDCVDPLRDERNKCWVSLLNDKLEADEEIIRKVDEEHGLHPPTGLLDFVCDGVIGCVPAHAPLKCSLGALCGIQQCTRPFGFHQTRTNFEKLYVFSMASSGKASSALVLPRMPGVHYDLVKFHLENKEIRLESFPKSPPWVDMPIKCVLLIDCRLRNRNAQVIKCLRTFLEFFEVSDNTCFALGGGRLRGGVSWPRGAGGRAPMFAIVVRGDNVTANSFMLKPHYSKLDKIEDQVAAFARNVGPLPSGSKRIAVMAQCIDRQARMHSELRAQERYRNENKEAQIIGKHFANIPVFGFVANGEIGYCSDPDIDTDNPPAKRIKMKPSLFINYQSTSLIVLTFNTQH
ncbi:uncharacterized protein LOC111052608 isoform X2 [Nilaparvata lugens]|uniref:uncharacterized protein LOC111052608 isoform X1 n=1 Tax=Nilaparvata lugens TaxID=108931 RepID=UPI00193DB126|nr:uncharacterized protein LOC111052608 isoform X1 [Nilaparvata lugens]XP_039286139.1 uncharacterized protein LOC111052608 isoform X2 [Nilaparvata lugens]